MRTALEAVFWCSAGLIVWTAIDRQIEVALKVGLLDGVPGRRLYDGLTLGAA